MHLDENRNSLEIIHRRPVPAESEDERDDEGEIFLPEELVAMLLADAANIASEHAGLKVKDCVIVIPNFLTHHQRLALADAANVAGLNVLGLMTSGSAAALTYGLNRNKEVAHEHHRVLFYDMGEGSTKATVVEFKEVEDHKKKSKKIPLIQTLGHGWDTTLGGREFTHRIAEFFAAQAQEKMNKLGLGDLKESRRGMARLIAESSKVKEVLSANQEAFVSVQDLVPDFDFASKITRTEFEEICEDLLKRVTPAAEQALAAAGLTPADIDFVEIIGGGTRVPSVQRRLADLFEREDLDRHLNGDEAAAFGAAFLAATQSTSFQVKTLFRVKDSTPFGVNVDVYEGINFKDQSESAATLFKDGNRFGSKKSLSFKLDEDDSATGFAMRLSYADDAQVPAGSPRDLLDIQFSELPDREVHEIEGFPKVSISFRLNQLGLIEVEKAETEVTVIEEEERIIEEEEEEEKKEEEEEEDVANGDEGVHGEKDEAEAVDNEEDATEDVEDQDAGELSEDEDVEKVKEEEVKKSKIVRTEKVKVQKVRTFPLKVQLRPLGILPLLSSQSSASTRKLTKYNERDQLIRETAEARNELESYVYRVRDRLEASEIQVYTTEEEKEEVMSLMLDTGDWLYGDGEDAELPALKKKLKEVKKEGEKIFNRKNEHELRDSAVQLLNISIAVALNATENITNLREVTDNDYDLFVGFLQRQSEALEDMVEEQKGKELHEDPTFKVKDLEKRTKDVERRAKLLLNKPKRKPVKVVEEKKEEEVVEEKAKNVNEEANKQQDTEEEQEHGEQQEVELAEEVTEDVNEENIPHTHDEL